MNSRLTRRLCISDQHFFPRRTKCSALWRYVHGHVDDSRITADTDRARSHFYHAWRSEVASPPEPAELSENFTGLRHHCVGPFTVEMSCLGVFWSLAALIARYLCEPEPFCDVPLPANALSGLREPPSAKNPMCLTLVPRHSTSAARLAS